MTFVILHNSKMKCRPGVKRNTRALEINMTANLRETFFLLCGIILICSSQTAGGGTCRGTCGHVQVSPHSSSMLGGRALRILSLVLRPQGRLLCRFKGEILREGFVDAEGHAHCISPLLYETGWVPVDVSTDGINFDRSGEYLSVHPGKADRAREVTLVNATQWQHYGTPGTAGPLTMTWNSSLIGADGVNMELWGYREFNWSAGVDGWPPPRAELSYLYSLGRNVVNSGVFSFIPQVSDDYSAWELGNVRITAGSESDGARDVQGLWSQSHVLAWHLERAFRDDSAAWAQNKCLQWDVLEKKLPNFLSELPDCPCTLAQARADTGRFHADYSCDIERGSVCTYHPGCVHCVRSIQASPTQGSGQQCCYDSGGALLLTGDSIGGSTPDRAHDWGSPPYVEPPRVPGYSHWLYDVLSFYYCCLWSDLCHVYVGHRPSSDCRSYRPPKAGGVFGDPHFLTFSGLGYTFNGRGEYELVSSPDAALSIQARTERVKLENSSLANATWLSSLAMQEKTSDVIEVRRAEGGLQVLRNQEFLPFTEQRWMDLHGVFVFVPSPQHVTVMFPSGVGVEVGVHRGVMAATVLLPSEMADLTRGLLGPMNSGPSDDATSQGIFAFGAGWAISNESSLFTYDSDPLLDTYGSPQSHDPAFVPAFSLPETPGDPLVADALTTCSGEGARFCKYDTLVTRSLAVGNSTLWAYRNLRALVAALQPAVSCGWLPAPRNGQKNGTRYLEGSTLSFSCGEGYVPYGSARRTCLHDGTWTGEQPCCVTDNKVGLVVGAAGTLSALVTMVAMIKLHTRKQDREKKKEKPQQMLTQQQIC